MEDGWARHLFYDTGNGEHASRSGTSTTTQLPDFNPAISTGLGLPAWMNHIAFDARRRSTTSTRRSDRWLAHGHDVVEIDHGWCTSIYTNDPNGIMVEFCTTTLDVHRRRPRRGRSDARRRAARLEAAAITSRTEPPSCAVLRGASRVRR